MIHASGNREIAEKVTDFVTEVFQELHLSKPEKTIPLCK